METRSRARSSSRRPKPAEPKHSVSPGPAPHLQKRVLEAEKQSQQPDCGRSKPAAAVTLIDLLTDGRNSYSSCGVDGNGVSSTAATPGAASPLRVSKTDPVQSRPFTKGRL